MRIWARHWHDTQGEWEAKGAESSTQFTAIDLSEGEWYDYDEKAGDEVSIKEVKWAIVKAWMVSLLYGVLHT